MVAVHFEEKNYLDDDFGKNRTILLFKDFWQADIWLKKIGYSITGKPNEYKKVEYHSEDIAKISTAKDMTEVVERRPNPWVIVSVIDSITNTQWVGFYDPNKDCVVSGSSQYADIVVNWKNVKTWEEIVVFWNNVKTWEEIEQGDKNER